VVQQLPPLAQHVPSRQHVDPLEQQLPPQHVAPASQQLPPQHTRPAGQTVSQKPQLLGSLVRSTHLPPQFDSKPQLVHGPEDTVQPPFWRSTHVWASPLDSAQTFKTSRQR
jgi:hypothetical protein